MNFTNTEGDYAYNGGHFYGVLGYKINQKISAGVGLGFDAVGMSYQGGIQSLKLNNTTGEIERNVSCCLKIWGCLSCLREGSTVLRIIDFLHLSLAIWVYDAQFLDIETCMGNHCCLMKITHGDMAPT